MAAKQSLFNPSSAFPLFFSPLHPGSLFCSSIRKMKGHKEEEEKERRRRGEGEEEVEDEEEYTMGWSFPFVKVVHIYLYIFLFSSFLVVVVSARYTWRPSASIQPTKYTPTGAHRVQTVLPSSSSPSHIYNQLAELFFIIVVVVFLFSF